MIAEEFRNYCTIPEEFYFEVVIGALGVFDGERLIFDFEFSIF
jgi:hypothetical protein